MIYGADLSEWQGEPAWEVLAAFFKRELSFLMLRTEDGLHKDGKFSHYCFELSQRGVSELGTYAFFRASKDPKPQVDFATLCHGDLPGPLAVDFETLDGAAPELAADRLQWALEELTRQTGRLPMIYTDPGDWMRLGAYGRSHHFDRYPLWIATIGSKPIVPPPFSKTAMWQYTWDRRLEGFAGPVDGDVFYGTLEEWREIGRPAVTDPVLPDLDRDPDSSPTGH